MGPTEVLNGLAVVAPIVGIPGLLYAWVRSERKFDADREEQRRVEHERFVQERKEKEEQERRQAHEDYLKLKEQVHKESVERRRRIGMRAYYGESGPRS